MVASLAGVFHLAGGPVPRGFFGQFLGPQFLPLGFAQPVAAVAVFAAAAAAAADVGRIFLYPHGDAPDIAVDRNAGCGAGPL